MTIVARALLPVALFLAATVPPAAATPARCANPCRWPSNGFAYVAPVQEIGNRTVVHFVTDDGSHPTTDSADPATRCFRVAVGVGTPIDPVRFDLGPAGLTATTKIGTPEEETLPCRNAEPVAKDTYRLTFGCLLHPWMNGVILIAS